MHLTPAVTLGEADLPRALSFLPKFLVSKLPSGMHSQASCLEGHLVKEPLILCKDLLSCLKVKEVGASDLCQSSGVIRKGVSIHIIRSQGAT